MKFGYVRQRPDDDVNHVPDGSTHFNESVYYNLGSIGDDIGGLLRMGNRVNEGYAEMTTLLFLPDRSVAFWYARPEITSNAAHDAAGMRCVTVEPHVEHRVTYEGKVLRLKDPAQMENPSYAFKNNPHEDCSLDVVFRGVSPTFWPWSPDPAESADNVDAAAELVAEKFTRNHLNQHMSVTGEITVAGERFTIGDDGLGWRDRSWGARSWQGVAWYRWASCNFGADLGVAIILFGLADGTTLPRGYVHRGLDKPPVRIVEAEFDTRWDANWYAEGLALRITTEDGARYVIDGEVWSHIPLRFPNKATGEITRVTEGMTRWTLDGRPGVGLLEYLDQIEDGKPVGVGL
jgi:hypothetical protein